VPASCRSGLPVALGSGATVGPFAAGGQHGHEGQGGTVLAPGSIARMSPELIGWLASVLFISRLLPQPFRLVRTGLPEGVSPLAAMNAVISETAWLVYGLQAGLVPVWAVSVAALVPGVWTVVLLRGQVRRRHLVRAGLWLLVIGVAAAAGVLGVVLGATVLVSVGPQVWTAIREQDLRGLSVFTWLLAIGDALLWGAYGLAVGDAALLGYAAILFTSAVIVLVRMVQTRSITLGRGRTLAPALDGV
jgi:uncharacterized protein with PQ loop repeat